MTPRTRLLLLALIPPVLVAGLWLLRPQIEEDRAGEGVVATGHMPVLQGPEVGGAGTITPSSYEGKVVLVNFWASWCVPCRSEQPNLEALWREYRDRGVQFVGVDFEDDPAQARAFLDEFDVSYPSIADESGKVAGDFQVPYIPTTVLADGTGELRYRLFGEQSPETVRRYLDVLLAEA